MNTATIVQKLWNYCNGPGFGQSLARPPAREQAVVREKPRLALRDDGMSYGDYPGSSPGQAKNEQLTYLLFLKMAAERTRQLLLRCPTFRHPWRSQALYNQEVMD